MFSDLIELSGPSFAGFKLLKKSKVAYLGSQSKYSLLCYNLTKRKVTALHFSSIFENLRNFWGYKKEPKTDRMKIKLDICNLILEKNIAPKFEYKREFSKNSNIWYKKFNFQNGVITVKSPTTVYLFRDRQDRASSRIFGKSEKYKLGYWFGGQNKVRNSSMGKNSFSRCSLFSENAQRFEYLDGLTGETESKYRFDSMNTEWGLMSEDKLESKKEKKRYGFVYLAGNGVQEASHKKKFAYRVRFPLDSSIEYREEYRVCFSEVYGRLFVLRAGKDCKWCELSTIRLDLLAEFVNK